MNAILVGLLVASAAVLVAAQDGSEDNKLSQRQLIDTKYVNNLLLGTPKSNTKQARRSNSYKKIGAAEQSTIDVRGSPTQTGVLKYDGNDDFEQLINPRNRDSDWKWMAVKTDRDVKYNQNKNQNNNNDAYRNTENAGKYVADGATFVRDNLTSFAMVSLPFSKYFSPDMGRVGILAAHEAVIVNKHKIQVQSGHQVSVHAAFQVKVHNVEDHPFGRQASVNASDDPSIATAGVSLVAETAEHGLQFSVIATDHGIWAYYGRQRSGLVEHPERNDKLFSIYHRLADRNSHDELIKCAIVYDRDQNAVHFKLNDVVLHTIENLGTLPREEAGTVAYTVNRADFVRFEPTEFTVELGLHSYMDETDPNNPTSPLRMQRLTNDRQVYDEKAEFIDTTGDKEKNVFGQGVELCLFDIVIKHEKTDEHNKINANQNKQRQARVGDDEEVPAQEDEEDVSVSKKLNKQRPQKQRFARRQDGEDVEELKSDDEEEARQARAEGYLGGPKPKGGRNSRPSKNISNN